MTDELVNRLRESHRLDIVDFDLYLEAAAALEQKAGKKARPDIADNWAHHALVLMDDAESLVRWGSVSAEPGRYKKAAKAFWDVCHLLADERARIAELEAQLAPVAPAVDALTVAWLHTMHMEGGQTNDRLTFDDENPFGEPGEDYSDEYAVTSTPLTAQSEGLRKDAIRRAALEEVTQEVRAIDEACTGASMQVNVLRAIRALAQREGEKT